MELIGDLGAEELASALPERPMRSYPALLSTDADARAWARAGAPAGAVVAAEYQASPRGRAGLEWQIAHGRGFAFSLVLRPKLPLAREAWLYVVAVSGLADALEARIRWPDEVVDGTRRIGAVGVHAEIGATTLEWAVASVLVADAQPPRAPLLAEVVRAIEARAASTTAPVLADYLRRCETIGKRVRARMIPMGPGGLVLEGRAETVRPDGSLVIETGDGRRLAIRAQNLGLLDEVG
jgi:BirA family biotin operon repressor/biotin-[acetyl-CoA-carboxylase] ligase